MMLPQGEIRRGGGGGSRPSVSRRQSQRPSTAGPSPTGTLNPVTLSAKTIICIRDVWVFKCVYTLSVLNYELFISAKKKGDIDYISINRLLSLCHRGTRSLGVIVSKKAHENVLHQQHMVSVVVGDKTE